MCYRVIPSPDAEANIESAIQWYVLEDVDLAFRFIAETTTTLRRIARNPFQFPVVNHVVRRALLKRFPYAIYFSLRGDTVVVTAVLHQRRLTAWTTD